MPRWAPWVSAGFLAAACSSPGPPTLAPAVRVCAPGAVTEGIDVSVYEGAIDWPRVKAAGIEFAYIRVSDGLAHLDAQFDANWQNAKAAGVLRGGYQFFRQDLDPIAQADLLLETMGPLEAGDLPPAIDVETTDGQTADAIVANVKAWMERVEAGSGKKPIIYTGRFFWDDDAGGSTAVNDHALWIPNWGVSCPGISAAWSDWAFWQYTSTGSIDGISGDVDRDQFSGDRAALIRFAGAVPPDAPLAAADAGAEPPDAPLATPDARAALDVPLSGCRVAGPATGRGDLSLVGALAFLVAARFPRRRARARIFSP